MITNGEEWVWITKAKLCALEVTTKGYYRAWVGGRNQRVHKLVMEAFVGPCPPGKQCLHRDGNGLNNRLENLRWGTPEENTQDMIKHGRQYMVNKWRARDEAAAG
jgi:hypothetical protein